MVSVLYFIAIISFLAPFLFWSFLNFSDTLNSKVTRKWTTIGIMFLVSMVIFILCIVGILLIQL